MKIKTMKIKTITLLGILLTLSIFTMASCVADTKDPLPPSDVSAANCADATAALNCFISVWNTENSGGNASDSKMVKLPLVEGGTYDFYVDWGDGEDVEKIEAYNADKVTHTYKDGGEQTIHIAGTIKGWRFYAAYGNYGDGIKLTDVSQWGSLSLGNTDGRQFEGASNFQASATDAPDLRETKSFYKIFEHTDVFNGAIGNWNVENVTNMSYAFHKSRVFNQDISEWDMSQVNTTEYMFAFAHKFNGQIEKWSVEKVKEMAGMFIQATDFNNNGKPLNWGEKTSNVTDMDDMFNVASSFNQNICNWNVDNVETSYRFAQASALENKHNPFHDECISTKSN